MILNKLAGLLATILALAWLAGCGGSSSGNGGSGSSGRNAYVAIPKRTPSPHYRVNTNSGNFTRVLGSPFDGGTSPVSVAVHPSGKFVYAANQAGNNISLFTIAEHGRAF